MPPESGNKTPLERLRDRLYAPKTDAARGTPSLPSASVAAAAGWTQPKPHAPKAPKKPGLPPAILFVAIAGGFFLVAVAVAAALIIFGGRTVSTDHIEILVDRGTPTVGSGDRIPLLITIRNTNPVAVSSTRLMVDFPTGTRSADDIATPLEHYEDTVGDIPPGGVAERTVQAVLFGAENERITIPIRFEYRTEGSNSPFVKEASYDVTISTSPLSVSVASLAQVSAGQPFTVTATVRSNAQTPLQNAAVLIEYPPGFVPTATDPMPLAGTLFDLGTMDPGEEQSVRVTGTLAGENRDTRVFRFTGGTRASAESTSLAVSYTTTQAPLTLEKPFIATTLALNRDTTGDTVLTGGETVEGTLNFLNTLAVPVYDASIIVKLSGSALDPASVRTTNGFYRSSDRAVVFSKETESRLATLAPGAAGIGTFTFATLAGANGTSLRNPVVTIEIAISGRRVNERDVAETVSSTITRTLKVRTDLALSATARRTTGPFANTGPWPPRADEETTYTVDWSLSNTVNSVAGAIVTATLPSYVRYTGAVSPEGANVSYNASTRTVTWLAGDVPAGTEAKAVSFQVALTPSTSQRGTMPVLVTGQTVTGTDRFTGAKLEGDRRELTTQIENDPAYQGTFGQVQ
ncbi:MAG TPA: hypothetical protein VHO23_00350 [Candidatus Paceibacterota bacterium]|nr:hypothetical protein [Candidatus Paceibacterota bacterium]